uniref:Sema domain, transmembrane domain (TM), and cytoplasmic domain, (semaphorin) 6Ca n=1 Tax=Cynoglossus semilaevis TaxID=244447 RepID=A0A3P8X0Y0_CYNSE
MTPAGQPLPWQRPWHSLVPCLVVTAVHFLTGSLATPFPPDMRPIRVVTSKDTNQLPGFSGLHDNDTQRLGLDFQRMRRINNFLFISARDHVFAVNLTTAADKFVPHLQLRWKPEDVSTCTVRGKNSVRFLLILVPKDDETLLICGTNAFNPTCRNYKLTSLEQVGDELGGQARCPFESHQSVVGLFADGDFYSATTTDFLASDAVVYRSLGDEQPVLRSVKYDSKWLREPHFLHAIDYGSYVYFFFSEIAVEYTALGKVVFSRVARVCKNDNGGSPRVLERHWTSFLKARLNCSLPGDSFFYFDVLQSVTSVLQINGRPAVVGVFTTQDNSILGSAVCSFYMDDIENVFSGKFKEQRVSDSSWTPVSDDQVPRPRPGSCAGDTGAVNYKSSIQFPDETLTFIKSYTLMDEAVPAVNERPCFTRTSSRSKVTQIAVDVSAGPFKDRTVLFLGSEDGRVLKAVVNTDFNQTLGTRLLEDIDVYSPSRCNVQGQEDRRVLALELDKDHHTLYVAFSSCVIRIPLSRCSQHGRCREACLSSRDPYCIWLRSGNCVNVAPGLKAGFEQDVEGEQAFDSDSCHADILATTQNHEFDPGYGETAPPLDLEHGANVHYTLLLACVLVAFFLGAVLSGFLVSCYWSHSSAEQRSTLGKDDEVSLPHALSLRTLAKLNALLEGTDKDKVGVSMSHMYSSFIPNGHAPSPVNTPANQHDHPALSLSQVRERSDLPTPYFTPELAVKNTKSLQCHQLEDNQNCNNISASGPESSGSSLGFRGAGGGSLYPLDTDNSLDGGVSSLSLPIPDLQSSERSGGGVMTTPQGGADMSALDEWLQHIQEVSASGNAGIKILTTSSTRGQYHLPHLQHHRTAASSSGLLQIPEKPEENGGVSVTRRPAHRHALVKISDGGGGVSRHHSFTQQSAPPARFLARMNRNNSNCAANANVAANASVCLTRQHSYNEGPHDARAALVRRTSSLKPQIPPKSLFLPNTSTPEKFNSDSD